MRNKTKDAVLGENVSTAQAKLRKSLLFFLAGKCNMLVCYRCGVAIDSIDEFSIEHKNAWQLSVSPKESFYDMDNIAFSHLRCNISAANHCIPAKEAGDARRARATERYKNLEGLTCLVCKEYQQLSNFTKDATKRSGYKRVCRSCRQSR